MDAVTRRQAPSAKVFWLVWLCMLLLAVGSFYYVLRFGPGPKATVFRRAAGKSETFPVNAAAAQIRVSDGGAVWVQTLRGLSRLENGAWHSFTASDFGTRDHLFNGEFTLDGEDVWATTPEGVLHFDGAGWKLHAKSVATQSAVSIVASKGQVWTIDRAGNLANFDGAGWSVRKVELPGVASSAWEIFRTARHRPKLAVAGNGRLWLIFEGVWRNEGTRWLRVAGTTRTAEFLGTTPASTYRVNGKEDSTRGGVYVLDGAAVAGYDVEGVKHLRYDTSKLDRSSRVYWVSGRAPTFAMAHGNGLYLHDGTKWVFEPAAKLGAERITNVAVAPDQSIWGIGQVQPSASAYSPMMDAAGWAGMILPFAIVGYPLWYRSRKSSYQRQASQEAVLHATGALPDELKGPGEKAWQVALGVVLFFTVGAAAWWALKKYWPAAPGWLLPVGFVAVHILATVTGSLKKRKALPNDPIQPGVASEVDWEKSQPAILGGLAVIVLLYGGSIARFLHIPYAAAMPGFLFLLGGQWLFRAFDRFRAGRVNSELKRGNYAAAREILDGVMAWPPTGLWKLARAQMLFYSGRAEEAEPILREVMESNGKLRSQALEELGRVLLAQARDDDAKRAFEAAMKLAPTHPAAQIGLAEVRLMKGVEAEQALEEVREARKRNADRGRLAAICGDEAWALGLLGRSGEVQEVLERGAREVDRQHQPELAGFHWRAGMALLALEQPTAGMQWLVKATELDPEGHYGKMAAKYRSQTRMAIGTR